MLVLSRKTNEALIIGDNIKITVLGIEGEQVRIGIDAPKDIRIYRKEIFDSIQEANLLATKAGVSEMADLTKILKQEDKQKK